MNALIRTETAILTSRSQAGRQSARGRHDRAKLLPGLLLAAGIAALAFALHHLPGFGSFRPMIIAIVLGIAFHNLAGTSICGASAVIATNTVTRAPDEDVSYAVACVTVFGSIAMFAYPLLPGLLQLTPHAYGLWAGASIHEIAQVVAAAFQDGKQAGEFGTVAKLTRVMMLAPVVIALGLAACQRARSSRATHAGATAPMSWFVLGFIAMVGVNSLVDIPVDAKTWIVALTTFLLTMALTAMGLETDIRKLRAKGLRPLFLGLAAFLFIATFSLILVKLLG